MTTKLMGMHMYVNDVKVHVFYTLRCLISHITRQNRMYQPLSSGSKTHSPLWLQQDKPHFRLQKARPQAHLISLVPVTQWP